MGKFMSRIQIIILTMAICFAPDTAFCGTLPQSDATILSEMLTDAVKTAIDSSHICHGLKDRLSIEIGSGIPLRPRAKDSIAAFLTERGYSIADSSSNNPKVRVAVTDARIIFDKHGKSFNRSITMSVHVNWYTSDDRLLYSERRELRTTDTISESDIVTTNNSQLFSPDVRRISIADSRYGLRLAALTGITILLTWLAYK